MQNVDPLGIQLQKTNQIQQSIFQGDTAKANTNTGRDPLEFYYKSTMSARPNNAINYQSAGTILPRFLNQPIPKAHINFTATSVRTKNLATTVEERRERSRLYQQRLRRNQTSRISILERSITKLRGEIRQLRREHDSVPPRHQVKQNVWMVATEYFHTFRYGFRGFQGDRPLDLDLLRLSMTADVMHNKSIGIEALLMYWKIITVLFPDIEVDLKTLKTITEYSVHAIITTTITLSEASLHSVFLQPKTGYERQLCTWIATKLQGQQLVMHGSVRFNWCSSSSRVTSLQSQTDMMTPLMQILDNIKDIKNAIF